MEDTRYKYGRYKWVLQGALLRQAYGGQSREQGAGSREKIQDSSTEDTSGMMHGR